MPPVHNALICTGERIAAVRLEASLSTQPAIDFTHERAGQHFFETGHDDRQEGRAARAEVHQHVTPVRRRRIL